MIINIPLQIDDATIQGQISKDYEKKIKDIIAVRIEEMLADEYRWFHSQNVTAWMPLPEPYAERREGNG